MIARHAWYRTYPGLFAIISCYYCILLLMLSRIFSKCFHSNLVNN